MNKRLLVVIGVMSLAYGVVPPVSANDFYDVLRGYIGGNSPYNSNVAGNQALIQSNMNTREAQLQSDVSAGVTTGQITPDEERDLRSELNRINSLKNQYTADGSYSNAEVQSMLNELMSFSTRLQTSLTNNVTTSNNTTYGNAWFNRYLGTNSRRMPGNQSLLRANMETRRAQLAASIDEGIRSGRLSWREARRLRNELDNIGNMQGRYSSDSRLSWRESQDLIADYNDLETQIQAGLNNRERTNGWQNNNRRSFAERVNTRRY